MSSAISQNHERIIQDSAQGPEPTSVGCLDGSPIAHVPFKMWPLGCVFLFLTSFASYVFASPVFHHVLHEKRHSPPPQWLKRSKLNPDTIIPVRIALNQRNLDRAEDFLYDVAHPRSLKYGQHWTARQVAEAFAPRYADLHHNGLSSWVTVYGNAVRKDEQV